MIKINNLKILSFIAMFSFLLIGCNGKLPGGDARKSSPNPADRVKKNIEEGRGFKLMDLGENRGGTFEFASSNELWRASLDTIDFMPLASVNYSGGIIITDWYINRKSQNESIKISIRFLTNEIRSDALDIKVFTRKCEMSLMDCKYLDTNNAIVDELRKKILNKAATYKIENAKKSKKNNMWSSKPKEK